MKRLCAYFDDESTAIIDKYEKKYGGSTAAILRKALQCLKNNEEAKEKTSWENIIAYVDFLANMEHVILDIAHWKLILTEIGKGSETFWEEMQRIGEEHTKEYYDKGLKNIKDILEYVEKTNWYRLSIDSDTSFTLILAVSESSEFIKNFFKGLLKNYPRKVEIIEDYKKIRIRVL